MIQILKNFKRSILFSFIIFFQFLVFIYISSEYSSFYYFLASAFLFVLFLLILYLDHISHTKKYSQMEIMIVDKSYYYRHLLNHNLVPKFVYLLTVVFLYLANPIGLKLLISVVSTTGLFLCLLNLRSYFINKLTIENDTHVVYDSLKVFMFFLASNSILHLVKLEYISGTSGIVLTSFTSLILVAMIFARHRLLNKMSILVTLFSFVVVTLSQLVLLKVLMLDIRESSIMLLTVFYFIVSLIHHTYEKTLTYKVILNYILIIVIVLLLSYGLK